MLRSICRRAPLALVACRTAAVRDDAVPPRALDASMVIIDAAVAAAVDAAASSTIFDEDVAVE